MFEKEVVIYCYNLFDLIKVWFYGDYLLIEVGFFELNCNLDNYFVEVEQVVFMLVNVVFGIGFLLDKMFQGCLFFYGDVYCYCLGVNYYQILVNVVCCLYQVYYCDGGMWVDGNNVYQCVIYELNSFNQWQEQFDFFELLLSLEGVVDYWNYWVDDDYYSQFVVLFYLFIDEQKQWLFVNIVEDICDVLEQIQCCQIGLFFKVDLVYGKGVVDVFGLKLD